MKVFWSAYFKKNRDNSVSVAANGKLQDRDSISGRGKIVVSTPQDSGRLWVEPSFLSDGYWGLFPQG
jgi:hypothetical protein